MLSSAARQQIRATRRHRFPRWEVEAAKILPPGVGTQLQPFRNLMDRILSGEPVGNSTKDFSDKYAALSAELLSKLDETQPGDKPSDNELAWTWIERNDAQNYVMLGDPAVRVRVDLLS